MCCLVVALMMLGPRFAILVWWITDQPRWERAFDSFAWSFLGFLFLPWTTLTFVLVAPNGGLAGFDWVWLAFGLMADLSSYGGSRYGRGYTSSYARIK
ncbi:MAG: hypothetical protein GY926_08970 [bacterium]|nr:hypothetical protein [bacterium]MCP4965355.1 hypothetical protein [bacterium]